MKRITGFYRFLKGLSFLGLVHFFTFIYSIGGMAIFILLLMVVLFCQLVFGVYSMDWFFDNLVYGLGSMIVSTVIFAVIDNSGAELERVEYINFKKELL